MNRRVSAITRSLLLLASLVGIIAAGTAALAQQSAVPFVNQPLSPTSIAPGHAAFTLTVNGTGFASDAVVNWNGSYRCPYGRGWNQDASAMAKAAPSKCRTARMAREV